MTVYGIYKGELHEGGRVWKTLYKNHKKAKVVAINKMIEMNNPRFPFKSVQKDKWSNGIDIIAIKKFEVI